MVVAALLASSTVSQGAERFTARSLRGAYGFTASGALFTGTPAQIPAVAVGVTTFNGDGGCTSEAKLNVGGTVSDVAASSCSYTVEFDGTGQQLTVFAGLGAFTTDFVIVDNGKEFRFIISDTPPSTATRAVVSGVANRQ